MKKFYDVIVAMVKLMVNIAVVWWCSYAVPEIHLTKSKLRFCASSNSVCSALQISNSDDLWPCTGVNKT